MAFFLSFTGYDMLQPIKFSGIENYLTLFLEDEVFIIALKNTFLLACVVGFPGMLLSLFIAWMINEFSRLLQTFLVIVFYAPAISGAALTVFKLMFSNDSYGFVNNFLMKMGFTNFPVMWLSDPKYIFAVVVIASYWMGMGTGFLAFVAGLKGVDRSLYEAAAIDGVKNRVQELWFVTVPAMKPQLMFSALISITGSLEIGGLCTGLVGFPSPNYVVHTIVLHIEDYMTTRFEMGTASAVAFILFLMAIGANKLVNFIIRHAGK
jgi:multiple sugar transport system permease protein